MLSEKKKQELMAILDRAIKLADKPALPNMRPAYLRVKLIEDLLLSSDSSRIQFVQQYDEEVTDPEQIYLVSGVKSSSAIRGARKLIHFGTNEQRAFCAEYLLGKLAELKSVNYRENRAAIEKSLKVGSLSYYYLMREFRKAKDVWENSADGRKVVGNIKRNIAEEMKGRKTEGDDLAYSAEINKEDAQRGREFELLLNDLPLHKVKVIPGTDSHRDLYSETHLRKVADYDARRVSDDLWENSSLLNGIDQFENYVAQETHNLDSIKDYDSRRKSEDPTQNKSLDLARRRAERYAELDREQINALRSAILSDDHQRENDLSKKMEIDEQDMISIRRGLK